MIVDNPKFLHPLRRLLDAAWPGARCIDLLAVHRMQVDWSSRTYALEVEVWHSDFFEPKSLVLRIDPPDRRAAGCSDIAVEHVLLGCLRQRTELPVPRSVLVDPVGQFFGVPAILLERTPGSERLWALRGGEAASVAEHLVKLIAALHTTPLAILDSGNALGDPNGWGVDASSWDAYIETSGRAWGDRRPDVAGAPSPLGCESSLTTLQRRPRPLPLCVVHGALRGANLLAKHGRVSGIFGWEHSHVGDPREDLAWFRHVERTSPRTHLLGGVSRDGSFLGYYNRLTGFDVTPEELDYFIAFNQFKVSQAPGVPKRFGMRPARITTGAAMRV